MASRNHKGRGFHAIPLPCGMEFIRQSRKIASTIFEDRLAKRKPGVERRSGGRKKVDTIN
jgi:hypothetical protein